LDAAHTRLAATRGAEYTIAKFLFILSIYCVMSKVKQLSNTLLTWMA